MSDCQYRLVTDQHQQAEPLQSHSLVLILILIRLWKSIANKIRPRRYISQWCLVYLLYGLQAKCCYKVHTRVRSTLVSRPFYELQYFYRCTLYSVHSVYSTVPYTVILPWYYIVSSWWPILSSNRDYCSPCFELLKFSVRLIICVLSSSVRILLKMSCFMIN